MTEHEHREALCEIGRRVWQRGFVAANDGNFSVRLEHGRVLATPTLISKGFMAPEDLVIVDLDGNLIEGRRRPTSELKVHLHAYRRRADVRAVVHAHPPHATAFCIARRDVPRCVLPEIELFIGEIPLVPYATPGTGEVTDSIDPFLAQHNVFLLASHGALTFGDDPFQAYYRMETLDQYCRILLLARQLGDWTQLDFDAMRRLLKVKERWGVPEHRDQSSYSALCATPPAKDQNEAPSSFDEKTIERIVREVLHRRGLLP
ncbi:MAG: class II aldolase/adducin family protein [Candidatus Sumerlaeia bacterium]